MTTVIAKTKLSIKSIKQTKKQSDSIAMKSGNPPTKRKYVKAKVPAKMEKAKPIKSSKKTDNTTVKLKNNTNLKKSFKIKIQTENKKDGKKKSNKPKLIMSIVKDDGEKLVGTTKTKKASIKGNAEKNKAKTSKVKENEVKIASKIVIKNKTNNKKKNNNNVADLNTSKKPAKKLQNAVVVTSDKPDQDEAKIQTAKNKGNILFY